MRWPWNGMLMIANVVTASASNYQQSLGATASVHPGSATSSHGMFFRHSSRRLRDCIDGTSNTAMFGEIRKGPNGTTSTAVIPAGDVRDFSVATNVATAFSAAEMLAPPAACETRATAAWLYRGLQYYRAYGVASYYSHTLTPNARFRDCIHNVAAVPATGTAAVFNVHGALRSYHTGMANFCLADGSVRSASDNIDLNVWRGVGTAAGGEVLGEF